MHVHTQRDVPQRCRVADARLNRLGRVAEHLIAIRQADGSEDVAFHAVGVLDQSDVAGAVGVVLDPYNLASDAIAITATEIDPAVHLLGPAATAANGDLP